MTSLSGRLSEGALADLLQYLALTRASGCLLLRHPQRRQAYVYFEAGRVVFIDARPVYDLAALIQLLAWRDGRFAFRQDVTAPRLTIDVPTATLLLQATQRADESPRGGLDPDSVLNAVSGEPRPERRQEPSTFARDLLGDDPFGPVRVLGEVTGALDEAFERAGGSAPESVSLSLGALHLWRRLDGHSSLRELARAAGLPLGEVVEAGGELLAGGLAEYVSVAVADQRFVQELAREAIDLLGPVGAILVEDALYELGLTSDAVPVGRVGELVAAVETAFGDSPARVEFMRRADELRAMFALEPVPGGRQ